MTREQLIAYSLAYKGEYDAMAKAIATQQPVEPIDRNDVLTILDEEYPKEFFSLENPPFVLYYRGNPALLKKEKIAVVGSRYPDAYGEEMTRRYCQNLPQGTVVVSGLAKGVDGLAHRYAGESIGILGCGIDYDYPRCNKSLIQSMRLHQLVLSEYPDDVLPLAYHFPFRNRLIAALSKRITVMQCQIQSGTMTTVREALTLGKDIYALPHPLFSQGGQGCNLLIDEGAYMLKEEDMTS